MQNPTIVDRETKNFLNKMKPNTVREFATAYWPDAAGADWKDGTLYLAYTGSYLHKLHWHKCSGVMAESLAEWIRKQTN